MINFLNYIKKPVPTSVKKPSFLKLNLISMKRKALAAHFVKSSNNPN